MNNEGNLLVREYKIVEIMIKMYCKNNHKNENELCSDCEILRDYEKSRLSKCRYGKRKSTCRRCKTQCYSPSMKEKIIKVMRFSGPRMIFYHPIYAFYYIVRKIRSAL